MPALAPASIDMLQTVIRSSMDKLRMTSPVYSKTYPVPPDVVNLPIRYKIRSFAVTPGANFPSTRSS